MAESENPQEETPKKGRNKAPSDLGQGEVQERFDEEQEQGFVGRKVDPTPNEAYSMEGGHPEAGDNPTAPSEDEVKADPKLGDQYEGQPTFTEQE